MFFLFKNTIIKKEPSSPTSPPPLPPKKSQPIVICVCGYCEKNTHICPERKKQLEQKYSNKWVN